MLTRGSLLQRHVLFRIQHPFLFCSHKLPFPVRMHVCASTGGSLAGDAGSGGRHSLTCQVALRALFLGLACCRFAVRGPHAHAFQLLGTHLVPAVLPDPEPMRMPTKKERRWVLFPGTLNWAR
jgi:hypothetical protein